MPDSNRIYLDPGSRMSGRYDPPRRCVLITPQGPVILASRYPEGAGFLAVRWRRGESPRSAPANVAVRYLDDETEAVIPARGRLRRLPENDPASR